MLAHHLPNTLGLCVISAVCHWYASELEILVMIARSWRETFRTTSALANGEPGRTVALDIERSLLPAIELSVVACGIAAPPLLRASVAGIIL